MILKEEPSLHRSTALLIVSGHIETAAAIRL